MKSERLLVTMLCGGLMACSSGPLLLFTDREDEFRTSGSVAPLQLPSDLSGTRIKPLMVVPDLPANSVANSVVEDVDPRPVSLLDSGEGDYIRIQKLGNRHWLVINEPPSIVWPRAKQFLVGNRVTVVGEDASTGSLETDWIPLDALSQDTVRRALRTAAADVPGVSTVKLYMRVEPGVREGSTEVHFRESNSLIAQSTWPERSGMPNVEDLLLKALGEALAQAGNDAAAISLRAQQMRTPPKSKLERGPSGRPQLTINLDFDRAWATVNQALSKAELEITDVNRDKGLLYLRVSAADLRGEEAGMLSRWFSSESDGYKLQLHLVGDAEHFSLLVDSDPETTLPPAFPEQLLTVIRNHAG